MVCQTQNKLVRHYPYATGLKTGSTSKAKFCISATARKDGMDLIAVIMAAPDSKMRVKGIDDNTFKLWIWKMHKVCGTKKKGGLKAVKVDRGTRKK